MLRQAGLRTQILSYDHNWTEHPNDIANTPPDETYDIDRYPQNMLDSSAARWVAGTAYHCYFGDPSAMSALHSSTPGRTSTSLSVRAASRPIRRAPSRTR